MGLRYQKIGVWVIIFLLIFIVLTSSVSYSVSTKNSKKVIKIGLDDTIPPFSYVDKNGKLCGFNVDLLLAMEKYTNITFKFVKGNWNEIMTYFHKGYLDAVMSIVPTPQRNKTFLFTEAYEHLYFDFFQRATMPPIKNINEIANHTIAVVKNDISEIFAKEWMNKTHQKLYLVVVNTPKEGLELLNSNSVDLFLYEIHTSSYFISKLKLKNVRLTNVEAFSLPIAIGVRKDEKWLVNVLNQAINDVKISGEFTLLYNNWFNPSTQENIPWYIYPASAALVVSVIIIVYVSVRYVRAQRRVKAQSKRIKDLMRLSTTLMENMPIGLLYVKNDKCIYANREATKILGYSLVNINKNKIFRLLLKDGEIKIDTKYGQPKWILTRSINYGDGKIISLIDITDKKMLELKELERFEFLNNMLDALRNPMQNILLAVEEIDKKDMQELIKREVEKIVDILKEEPEH